MDVVEILKKAIDERASDIYIVAGAKIAFKTNGEMHWVSETILTPQDTRSLIEQLYRLSTGIASTVDRVDKHGEDDFSFSLSQLGRFRVNAFYQRGSLAAVLRVVRFELPDPKDYHIPSSIIELSGLNNGLVLVTGATGCGKSTTLACIVDEINRTKNYHIITIEDPIEYLHRHNKSIVSQRKIGHDTDDYVSALRAALRETPNVILVGEMRDVETVSVSLSAAETGHLVLSTLHTSSASETISRIIDIFPPNQQAQIRVQLTMSLQAVISQRLLQGIDGKLVPCFEIMKMTPAIKTQIRDNKLHLIDNTIASSKEEGMISMDESILNLYKQGLISQEVALSNAINRELLKKKL